MSPLAHPAASRPLLGIGLILLMGACFAVLDTTVKFVVLSVPVLAVVWSRYLIQAIVMASWLLRPAHRHLLRAAHPRFQFVRGMLLLIVSALGFFGLQFLPVAEFTAVVMLTPVLVTVLAVVVLKERLTPLRWMLVAGGFAGALVIVRPGSGLFGWAALIPALAALCYAAFQLLTRRMAGLEHPLTTHFYTGLVGTAVSSAVLAFLAEPFWLSIAAAGPGIWALMLLVGVLGTFGHLLLILALGMAPVSLLMPFTYGQILFATLTGWIAFDHVPDTAARTGMLVIAACGGAAVWLNARQNARDARARVPDSTVAADTIGD